MYHNQQPAWGTCEHESWGDMGPSHADNPLANDLQTPIAWKGAYQGWLDPVYPAIQLQGNGWHLPTKSTIRDRGQLPSINDSSEIRASNISMGRDPADKARIVPFWVLLPSKCPWNAHVERAEIRRQHYDRYEMIRSRDGATGAG
jgi:hypothetical protein